MPCKLIEKINQHSDIEAELSYQYDKLKLIMDNDEKHEFIKGFKYCMDIIQNKISSEYADSNS